MQATLANLPLDQVNQVYAKTDPQYASYAQWAEEALVTAVFCIIICGAFGTLAIRWLAPVLLDKVCSLPRGLFLGHATIVGHACKDCIIACMISELVIFCALESNSDGLITPCTLVLIRSKHKRSQVQDG